jgi:flagellar assembly protein FliH
MSSGNAHQERLQEELDAAIEANGPSGKLEDAEIQRLVALSNDASYQRSERVPVKTVEAFEPRSLVAIAMAAQRRRESELRVAMAAGAVIDEDGVDPAGADIDTATEAGAEGAPAADPAALEDPVASEVSADTSAETEDAAETPEGEATEAAPSSTSQVDFEAGRAEGLEEGRRVGFDEGQAKGMEEGRAAGRAEASAQLERVIQAFESASARLADLTAVDSEALGASINEAILRLASERAGRAIAEQPASFANRIEALLATIRTVSGQPSIRLSPSDLASIQPLAETREKLRHCNFVADASLANGDLSVMIGTIGIDDIILPRETGAAGDKDIATETATETATDTVTDTVTDVVTDVATDAVTDAVTDTVIDAGVETGEMDVVADTGDNDPADTGDQDV